MSDIFEDLFGFGGAAGGARQGGRGGRQRGDDLRYNMEITLKFSSVHANWLYI